MTRFLAITLLALLGGCSAIQTATTAATSTVPQTVINDARTALLGLENLYGVALIAADNWAQQPRCGSVGANPAPLCSTAAGTIALNKAALAAKVSFTQAEGLVLKASPAQSDLNLAVASAQAAWSAYQSVLAVYSIKGG